MRLKEVLIADYARNDDRWSKISVAVFRVNQWAYRRGFVLRSAAAVADLIWLRLLVGAELPPDIVCGPGLRLAHMGRGVIVNRRVRIGSNVTLYHRVTLGVIGSDKGNVPTLEDGVYVGTGATVIGRVLVGEGARIGAGAVVTKDVPAFATAVGVPATNRLRAAPTAGEPALSSRS
ncbi:hypothetical protein [Microbacterium pumilum]|uniref:Serine acetyltransferase n=1 Tax=Microbacterium pumilum TaxID=344165 RepID=A0ABN2SA78_9MICO